MKISSLPYLFIYGCSALCMLFMAPCHLQSQSETHLLKFHLIRYKIDSVVIPAIYKYNRRRTDSTLKRAATVISKSHHHPDSNFSNITIKVFENGDTLSSPVHTFSNIAKSALSFNNSTGQGYYELTGLTASRKKMTACVYRDAETFIAFKQDFHVLSEPLKPLPETPTHPSVIAKSPEPPVMDLPIGTVLPYMMTSFSHLEIGGWFLCDGRAISSLDHLTADEKTELISLLTAAGNPNPNNLPDLRGYFLRGVDGGSGNDPDHLSRTGSGHRVGGIQGEEFKSHNHTQANHTHSGTTSTNGNHTHTWNYGREGDDSGNGGSNNEFTYASGPNYDSPIAQAGDHSHSFTTGLASNSTINSTGGNETRPKNIGVNYIIKVRR